MKFLSFFLIVLSVQSFAQVSIRPLPYVEMIENAEKDGVSVTGLDGRYKSAVHIDSTKAVFKTEKRRDSLVNAYTDFLQQLGDYLKANGYKWEKETKCWNRIYFRPDGTVDYYLFRFRTEISDEKVKRYKDLFRSFAATHKIGIHANENFAQCSPVVFMDE
jgi:hypothetical protein